MYTLTTGQMIDQLCLKDVAINKQGYKVGYDEKGNLMMWGEHEEKPDQADGHHFIVFYPWIRNDRWIINYEYVNYEEAMEAHTRHNKTIIYQHSDEMEYRFSPGDPANFQKLANDSIELRELVKGRWRILP